MHEQQFTFTLAQTGEVIRVSVAFNLEDIARTLAARAVQSKAGRATMLGGDIVCRVTARNLHATPTPGPAAPPVTDIPVVPIGYLVRAIKGDPSDRTEIIGHVLMRECRYQVTAPQPGLPWIWAAGRQTYDTLGELVGAYVSEGGATLFAMVTLGERVARAVRSGSDATAYAAGLTNEQVQHIRTERGPR